MKTPLISVIMPAYNAEKYISDSIDSVLNQSIQNFELIIIDDNSQDNTTNIINKYNDPRIVLIINSNN
ncbi:glycosyltransferase family 2 protein, partial [Morganella morganii]|nr:glycosyltransferase family 2 protein [Morganella morganii]